MRAKIDGRAPGGACAEPAAEAATNLVAQPTMLGAAIAAGYVSTAEVAKELTADMPKRALGALRRQRGRDMLSSALRKGGESRLVGRRRASDTAARMSVIH